MINVWQIYYDEQSFKNCNQYWNLYDNGPTTDEFFENRVIKELIEREEHRKEKYFAVFPHNTQEKVYFKQDGMKFSPFSLKKTAQKYHEDVLGFCGRRESENIVLQAESYHPGIVAMTEKILDSVGLKLPKKLDKIVLFNLFAAREHFWDDYTKNLLFPAMEILKTMPEAYEDSQYDRISSRVIDDKKRQRFLNGFGKPHYPFHPFILERLPSVFLQLNPQYSFRSIFS